MRSMVALIRREFIEHKGAFFYAPLVLLGIFTLAMVSALAFNKVRLPVDVETHSTREVFEVAFLGTGWLWSVYLMVVLFFYYADAFNADRRNNAMLFWKSMPLSDFRVLASKMLSGLTLFPAVIFGMIVATGIVLYGVIAGAVVALPMLEVPGLDLMLGSTMQVGGFTLVYLVLSLLWYAPFFAWVGALSTAVGRWSIPLAFLIPGLAVLGENLIFRGLSGVIGDFLVPGAGPRGGYILDYLRERSEFGPDHSLMWRWLQSEQPFSAAQIIASTLANIDWTQMVVGLVFTVFAVYAASEYRRRVVAT
jgi:ABC-2 type transport system permease protein